MPVRKVGRDKYPASDVCGGCIALHSERFVSFCKRRSPSRAAFEAAGPAPCAWGAAGLRVAHLSASGGALDIPIRIRNAFTSSDSLDRHIARCLDHATRSHRSHVRHVEIRLSDINGPRHGAADKVAAIEIALAPLGGLLVVRGKGADIYQSVSRAANRAKQALSRYASRQIRHRSAESRHR
jgi:putative sigma-54 modulation protein